MESEGFFSLTPTEPWQIRAANNIGPGGCTAGAVMTFGEAVTGAAGATIAQPVTVPGLDPSTATFVLR